MTASLLIFPLLNQINFIIFCFFFAPFCSSALGPIGAIQCEKSMTIKD